MSRGLGKVQNSILAILREKENSWLSTTGLLDTLYGKQPTESQKQAFWRALRTLEKKEKILSAHYRFEWGDRFYHKFGRAAEDDNLKDSLTKLQGGATWEKWVRLLTEQEQLSVYFKEHRACCNKPLKLKRLNTETGKFYLLKVKS